MKPAPFLYFAPRSAQEAVALLAEHGEDGRVLAGGQSLMPLMNLRMARPAALIDINRASDLSYIRRDGDWIAVGTMTRQADAEHDPLVHEHCPLLAQAISFMGHTTIRNRGTVGGSIAHADSCAELPTVAMALGAEMVVAGVAGDRTCTADEFFIDSLYTVIEPGEMLREVRFPVMARDERFSFVESGVRRADLAVAGIAARLTLDDAHVCRAITLVALGGGARPIRLLSVEAALLGNRPDAATLAELCEAARDDIDPTDDLQASAEYRREILVSLTHRALTNALSQEARR
jgi:CO/xanthine dehydrogenase FAD-binding subunit